MEFVTADGQRLRGIKGYKGLTTDNRAILGKPFQYEQGKIFEEDCEPRFKHCGFHFCLYLEDVKLFVGNAGKIVEVYALGEVEGDSREYCTNKIYIGEEVGK